MFFVAKKIGAQYLYMHTSNTLMSPCAPGGDAHTHCSAYTRMHAVASPRARMNTGTIALIKILGCVAIATLLTLL